MVPRPARRTASRASGGGAREEFDMGPKDLGKHDQVLLGLAYSLQAAAMAQLGKLKNPLTDRLERDLEIGRAHV